jgi:hypothetical protein
MVQCTGAGDKPWTAMPSNDSGHGDQWCLRFRGDTGISLSITHSITHSIRYGEHWCLRFRDAQFMHRVRYHNGLVMGCLEVCSEGLLFGLFRRW